MTTNQWTSRFLLSAVLVSCFVFSSVGGIKTVSSKSRPAFLDAMSDFYYVGSGDSNTHSVPPHGMKRKGLPSHFEVGRQYIFHHRKPNDNYKLFEVLQERLRSRGVTVLAANDDGSRFIGGLLFKIDFKEGNYKGSISNTLDKQIVTNEVLGRQWHYDDYVLTFESVEGPN